MRSTARVAIPGLAAAVAGAAAQLVWGLPAPTVLAAGIGAFAAALALERPEEETNRRPRPARSGPAPRGARNLPASHRRAALPAGAGQMLLEQLPLGVLLIDAGGRVLFINASAVEMIGRRPPGEFHSSALRVPRLLEAIEAALADGVAEAVDFSLSRGREIHLCAHVRPLADPALPAAQGRRISVMVVIEDRTRSRRAEELHRDFVANASHELKTPLSTVSGIIETLQGHARDDPEASERFFRIMAAQTERMKHLVDDLLSLNRIELNERVFPREPQSLAEIVGEVGEAMQPVARARGATLEVSPPDPDLTVRGSFEELSQVLRNLVDNAIKYGREGGRIALSCRTADPDHPRMAGIAVEDDGPGIAREHIPRLTERFYRVSVSRSRARGGTGLGLAIVKHVVNRHRGQLEIESEPGRGSRFTVWLPLAPADEDSHPPSTAAGGGRQKPREARPEELPAPPGRSG